MTSVDDTEDLRGEQTIANQQDSPALIISQVHKAQRTAHQSPSTSRDDEDDRVFLCGFASEDIFVGSLDDEDSITDEGIEDFIRQNNPDIFRRLFTAEDTSVQAQANSCAGYHTFLPEAKLDVVTTSHDLNIRSSSPNYYELRHVLLQFKHLLVSSLLGGHVLVLQKVAASFTICCGHPYCHFRDTPVPRGTFALELRLEGGQQVRQFCLECIEHVFSCRAASAQHPPCLPTAPMVALDGTAEILAAAQNLAGPLPKVNGDNGARPRRSPKPGKILPLRQKGHANIKNYFQPDFPFNHRSNSAQALFLRRRRDVEIEEILNDVKKYNNRRQDDAAHPQKSPLVITPPPQLPGEERYKKQGLSKWNKEKGQDISRRETHSGSSSTSTNSTEFPKFRICKCGEPAGVGVVITCASEFCVTGRFHLECTGLLQKLASNLTWTCSDCSGIPEGSLFAADTSDEREELAMDDDCDYDYGYDHDEEPGHGDNWDHESLETLSESDRMSLNTGSRTASTEDLFDSDCTSLVTGTKVACSKEPMTPPKVVAAVNDFTSINEGTSKSPITPSQHITQVNSFTPVNPHRTPGAIIPFSIRHIPFFCFDGGPPAAKGQATPCVPVGSELTFEDLAPFIIAETNVTSPRALAPQHVDMLEEWKAACPNSSLLPGHRAPGPSHVKSVQTVSLSHLLAMVDFEMADR